MPHDPAFQADLAIRLIAAAFLGAAIGLERELHGHQAGMRTHMLVSLGSALFTILSIYGFPQVSGSGTTDTSRIAAQVVTGIGFLGAGAIVKYGTNIRGLTTAASLWVVAAVGLAAGAAEYFLAVVTALIAVLSLWPLHRLVQRLELTGARQVRLRLSLTQLDAFAGVSQVLLAHHVEILTIQSERHGEGHQMDLELRLPRTGTSHHLMTELQKLAGVEVRTISQTEEA